MLRLSLCAVMCTGILAGCKDSGGIGTVTGKVTVDGKPLGAGQVSLLCEDGRTASGWISTDGTGTYRIESAPAGNVTILVDSQLAPVINVREPTGGVRKIAPPGKYVPIPEKYNNSAKTPLRYTVLKGEQEYDIVLESTP